MFKVDVRDADSKMREHYVLRVELSPGQGAWRSFGISKLNRARTLIEPSSKEKANPGDPMEGIVLQAGSQPQHLNQHDMELRVHAQAQRGL